MSARMQVWPGLGLRIKYPGGKRVLSVDGASVPLTRYWLRRKQYLDVLNYDPRPKKKTTKKAAKKKTTEAAP